MKSHLRHFCNNFPFNSLKMKIQSKKLELLLLTVNTVYQWKWNWGGKWCYKYSNCCCWQWTQCINENEIEKILLLVYVKSKIDDGKQIEHDIEKILLLVYVDEGFLSVFSLLKFILELWLKKWNTQVFVCF